MYYVSGSNLFNQWPSDKVYFNQFYPINEIKSEQTVILNEFKIAQVNWSYNILNSSNTFYTIGACKGEEKQFVKIPLPAGVETICMVAGNDYQLLFIDKNTIWVMNLGTNEFRKLKITENLLDNPNKKAKIEVVIMKVSLINDACLYLTTDGSVYSGILPSLIDTRHCMGKICDIQCGYEHFVILTDVGRVYSWGNGRRLQLGHGDVSNLELPAEVEALGGIRITKIVTGGWHTLALSESGDLYAWGWNDTGQLGIKETEAYILNKELETKSKNEEDLNEESFKSKSIKSYSIPTLVDLIDEYGNYVNLNVIDIACGSRHSVILLDDGSVWGTGWNKYGQLGLSNEEYPFQECFKKVFHVDSDCTLSCGPWTTVLNVKSK